MLSISSGFGLNTDVFETNILNLAVVVGVVVTVVGDAIKTLLAQRRQTILSTMQDATKKVQDAQKRLEEARSRVEKARARANEIRIQTIESIQRERLSRQKQLEEDKLRLHERKLQIEKTEFQREQRSIRTKLIKLAMAEAESHIVEYLSPKNVRVDTLTPDSYHDYDELQSSEYKQTQMVKAKHTILTDRFISEVLPKLEE